MTTATPEPQRPRKHLKPGQIDLDLLPADWALTPLNGKRAYVPGWTQTPYSAEKIQQELDQGRATGVGLLTGEWSNEGGLIWVDIDGPDAIPALEELAGGSVDVIFPPTLTISSGKEGRMRMLYSVPAAKISLLPDKATIKIGIPSFEILFRSRQGAVMGAHPETDGYFTTAHGGFEYAKNPPEVPEWLYTAIAKAFPTNKYRKPVKGGVITQQVSLSYEEGSKFQIEAAEHEARVYLEHLQFDRTIDYEEWLAVGMALHQVSEDLLADWVEWSSHADNFQDGVCEEKWRSFERLPGGPSPEGARGLQTLRAKAKEDGFIELGGFVVESPEVLATKAAELFAGEEGGAMTIAGLEFGQMVGEIMGGLTEEDQFEINQRVKGKSKPKTPPASELAETVTVMMRQIGWLYDPRFDTFMFYQRDRGTWRRETHPNEYKYSIQDLFVLERGVQVPGGFTSHLLADVANLTKAYLLHDYWDDDPDRLAFKNGVLEISTGEFLEHDRENYMTWGLDFEYDPSANPGPIIDWLKRTQYSDEDRVQVLRAWLRACLAAQGQELQRFLEVIGPGGRGKSTFANLCCAMVGSGNYASTTLNQLEQTRFEVASSMCGDDFLSMLTHIVESDLPARSYVETAVTNRHEVDPSGEIIVFPSGGLPWKNHLYELEHQYKINPMIKYVLYTDQAGMWRIQCVSVEGQAFENRLSLPKEWRGVRDEDLAKVAGIEGCTFCHAAGFIGGNKSYEGALEMARVALKVGKEEE